MLEVALVGNPNTGKSTLFNALTGARQRVGHWPGVTVERHEGLSQIKKQAVRWVDLPGTYGLSASGGASIDEQVACEYLWSQQAQVVIHVVDASNLERNLYLSTQLLDLGVPVIVALNMTDVATKKGLTIDVKQLQRRLGCPVLKVQANRDLGLEALCAMVVKQGKCSSSPKPCELPFSDALQCALDAVRVQLPADIPHHLHHAMAVRLLEGDNTQLAHLSPSLAGDVAKARAAIQAATEEDIDTLMADARYQWVEQTCTACVTRVDHLAKKKSITARIDQIVLNRFLGIPIFLCIMYAMFVFAINVGGAFQDFFDIASSAIFVGGVQHILALIHAPAWLAALLAQGVGLGINTVVTFIPVIAGMFIFLSFLEQSGYMVRAACVVDRLMRALGLPGKAFVPMIVGFGCNVPAVMAARTLDNQRDRVLTVMMSPFMSCGARLAIFAVFVAAFFPHGGGLIIFMLYLTGILAAVMTGFMLRKTLLQGNSSPLIMELPPYHWPPLRMVMIHSWHRLRLFVLKAGKIIIPICVLLGFLNVLTISGQLVFDGSAQSCLSWIGRLFTPLFAPMGLHIDNWPATVGLFTGVLAKEVVIGTLNTLYSQVGHLSSSASVADFHFWLLIKQAFLSIKDNVYDLGAAVFNPVLASAPMDEVSSGVMGQMVHRFAGQIGAFSYLLFVLLYIPCISTVAVMARELGRAWAWFAVFWTTAVAYGVSVFVYQAWTIQSHVLSSVLWLLGILFFFSGVTALMQQFAKGQQRPAFHGEVA